MNYRYLLLTLALGFRQTAQAQPSIETQTQETIFKILDFHKNKKRIDNLGKTTKYFVATAALLSLIYRQTSGLLISSYLPKPKFPNLNITHYDAWNIGVQATRVFAANKIVNKLFLLWNGNLNKTIISFTQILKDASAEDRQRAANLISLTRNEVAAKTCLSSESKARHSAIIADFDRVLTEIAKLAK